MGIRMAADNRKRFSRTQLLAGILALGWAFTTVSTMQGQTAATQTPPAQNIPDAPSSVQPPSANPDPPPPARPPEEKKPEPVARDPWTNQPINKTAPAESDTTLGGGASSTSTPTPTMPPVRTVPAGTAKKPNGQEELYTYVVHTNFVQVPVTVKDREGRRVDGLLSTDFTVKENGTEQKLTFFTADPFALSVAIVLDTGMPDAALQKVNQTFSALVGAFAPYDEIALYTYSGTVSEVSDFAEPTQKLTALLNQMKTERGRNNGPPILSGPLAPNGPIINGVPVGSPTEPVYTPPKEAHVLNDAILRAALDLSKRSRTRRKIIFVISDGRESGSRASYKDVLRLLLSNEVQVQAVAVDSAALPLYGKLERMHLPHEGYGNILPRYTAATGGAQYSELSRGAIEDIYAQAMSEARNEYTLGYTPTRPKTPTTAAYREIEVVVHKPGLKITAKNGYYPALSAH
ncbi:MAG: VWA domain-containing protein [Candidatus Sulfotelmatobacter sp.]